MAKVKTYVTIGGVDVTSYVLRYETTDKYNEDIPKCKLVLTWSVATAITVENGPQVVIKRGYTTGQEQNVFKGYITAVKLNKPYVEMTVSGMLVKLIQSSITKSFDINIDTEAGVASEIVKTMINDYTDLSADNTSVVNTGTTDVIEKFVCIETDVYERIEAIAGIYGYQFYYNLDDDLVYFEPEGYSTNSTNLEVGVNVTNLPTWVYDNSQLINKIRINGAESYVETTEEGQIGVTSGYTTSSIQLTQSPFSVKVFSDSSSPPTTLRKGGVEDSTGDHEYEVDRETNQIIWNTSVYTPGASDYVEILYTYPVPVPVIRRDTASISAYGESSTVKTFSDIKSVEDATNRATLFLQTYATPFTSLKCNVTDITNDYRVGQRVTVTDVINDIESELVITQIKRRFPHNYDEITVGDKEYTIAAYNTAVIDRIKRIEEEFTKNTDLVNQIFDFERTFTPQRRYLALQTSSVAGTTLIWGHPTFGEWGTYNWGSSALASFILGSSLYGILGTSTLGSAFSTPVTIRLVQGKMTYDEYCYDTEFHNSTDSTATFDTSNKRIDFTSGQVWYSNPIDIGSTLVHATVTLGTKTGTFTIEISADSGVTWQTLSEATRTTLTSSDGTSCIVRITESGGSTGRIEPTTDAYGQRTFPAIRCRMEQT